MKNLSQLIKLTYSKKLVKYFIIPIALLVFWLFASVALVYYPPSFSVVSKYHDKSSILNFSEKKILKGDRIEGFVEASENNFGILAIRFNQLNAVKYEDQDILVFRIKEMSQENWLAVNFYRSGIIDQYSLFPFGFPRVVDSKGKIYEFQIISLKGNKDNSISLLSNPPIVESQYKFSKSEILKDGKSLTDFIVIKLENFLTDKDSILLSFPYLVPLIIYIFLVFIEKLSYRSIFYLVLFSIIADSLTDYRTIFYAGEIVLIFAWIFSLIKYKLNNSISFSFSACFILLSLVGIITNQSLFLQKSSEWAYYLMIIGTAQIFWEIKHRDPNLISIKNLFNKH